MQTKRSSIVRTACALPVVAAVVIGGCTSQPGPSDKTGQAGSPITSPLVAKAIMPIHRGPVVERPSNGAPLVKLKYYGGRILGSVQVVQVLWGTGVDTEVATKLGDYYKGVLNSDYMDWLGEYDTISVPANMQGNTHATTKQHLGRGSFLKTVQITPSAANAGANISDDQIAEEIKAQIDSGVLPAPDSDGVGGYRTLYMIDFPASVGGSTLTITGPSGQGTSCVEFCAYHGATTYKGGNLAYGVHPDVATGDCATGCGTAATPLQNATSVHSHEMIEAATDPDIGILIAAGNGPIDFPVGWYCDAAQCGEIGDICNAQQGTVGTYTVQKEWSNAQGGCILNVPGLTPCVDGKGGACSPCTADSQCSGTTPVCATDAADFKVGQCVACKDNTKCSGATPACDKSTSAADDTCRACKVDKECPTATPRCVGASGGGGGDAGADGGGGPTTGGKCMECTVNDDCKASTKGPVCDTATNACRGCTSDTECTTGHCATGAADPSKGKCVQCTTDAQCTGGTVCDTAKDTCVGCKTNAQCKNPKPTCDTTAETCAVCKANADCASDPANPECNVTAGTCGPVGSGGSSGSTTNTTSSGCAVSSVGSSSETAFGFAGALFGLGLVVRRRRRAA